MSDCQMSVEQMVQRMKENWDQENLGAAFTIIRLYRARDMLFGRARQIMEQFELNPGEFNTLASLRKVGAPYTLTPSEICQANLVSSGGMTKVLNSLEKRGYISREQNSSDLRSRLVKLTPDGKKLIEKALSQVLASHENSLSQALTAGEREIFDKLLIKLHST